MNATFKRVSWWKHGYSPEQVDDFLADAKNSYAAMRKWRVGHSRSSKARTIGSDDVALAGFKLVRRGYDTHAVDEALARLETAFVQRKRAGVMATQGEARWLDSARDSAKSLYPRLTRRARHRFADAHKYGYEKDSVDLFLNRIREYFNNKNDLTAQEVRTAVFPRAKSSDAYDEAVVDAYLDRVVSVMLAVE